MKYAQEKYRAGFVEQNASVEQITDLYENFIYPLFGSEVMPLETAIMIQEKCPSALKLVFERNSDMKVPVGFYSMIPINDSALETVCRDFGGSNLTLKQVDNSSHQSYLSAIAAFGMRARVATLSYAYSHGLQYQKVFSVPVTDEGLNWVSRMGFLPRDPNQSGIKQLYSAVKESVAA